MRRALYASGGIHALLLLWIVLGDTLFRDRTAMDFEVTGVTLLTTSEFDALMPAAPLVPVTVAPSAPVVAPNAEAPSAPLPEAAAPAQPDPVQTVQPEAEVAPDVTALAPLPQAEVADTVTLLSAPAQDLFAPLADQPTPREAPRVAPAPAQAPPPEAEIAPEVVERPAPAEEAATPTPEVVQTAPEEATTEIVTEAEAPARSNAPVTSTRPTARPTRVAAAEPTPPAPVQETAAPAVQEPAEDPMAAAIAAAVAEAASAPAPSAPSGPPLTSGERDGLRVAVQTCWNVGSLSSEALRTIITVTVEMARDGRPQTDSIRMIGQSGGNDATARQAFETARRAIIRCGASGYDLPIDKYDQWRTIEMTFNPEEMRLR